MLVGIVPGTRNVAAMLVSRDSPFVVIQGGGSPLSVHPLGLWPIMSSHHAHPSFLYIDEGSLRRP